MTVDLIALLTDTPIIGLEIKSLEKTDNRDEYRITDKDAIAALYSATAWPITEARLVDSGDLEAEWTICADLDLPLDLKLWEDDYIVFDVTSMEGTPADLV